MCHFRSFHEIGTHENKAIHSIYLDEKRGGGVALMHVYVLEHIVSLCYRTTWWMFTKLGRDEVLMAPHL